MRARSLIDMLSRRSPSIVTINLAVALFLAWFWVPAWIPTVLSAVVALLALVLFAASGGRNAHPDPDDDRTWLDWELAGKGTPAGSYVLAFFSFVTVVITGIETPYARPAWAALALTFAWALANRAYPAEEDSPG